MGIVRIDISGEIEESGDRPNEKGEPNPNDRPGREMPDLQIVEIGYVPEKGTNTPPPWEIQKILDIIENTDKAEKNDLPN